jgi:amino acid adenylation domain-containing protein
MSDSAPRLRGLTATAVSAGAVRNRVDGAGPIDRLTFWKNQLAGLSALELPTDHPRQLSQPSQDADTSFALSVSLTRRLRRLSDKSGVPLSLTLLSAFQVLLHRYSRQDDVVLGSRIHHDAGSSRGQPSRNNNTLVLRTDLSGNPAFDQVLQRNRSITLEAQAHYGLTVADLVQELQPERDSSRHPLYQVSFELLGEADLEETETRNSPLEPEYGPASLELAFSLADFEGDLRGSMAYNAELFDESTIRRMLGHFRVLLEAAANHPQRPIDHLPLLEESERRQVLFGWNQTAAQYPSDRTIHELFEEQAARTPDAVALSFSGRNLTYDELNRRANQLANRLIGLGAGRESVIGLCVERSPEAIIAILAVHKSGAAYVPLDPAYPPDRLSFMLQDAGVRVLLTQESLRGAMPAGPKHILCVDSDRPRPSGRPSEESDDNLGVPVDLSDLAYVIYTSGSTGKPKGVLVEHRGIPNLVFAQIRAFGVEPGDRVLQFASLSFDASVSEIWMALLSGATLCLAPAATLMPGPTLEHLLREQSISVVTLSPSILEVMSPGAFPELRSLIVAGEACSTALAKAWSSGRRFINAYGPTENTVCATISAPLDGSVRPPIGRPMANTRSYVLDAHLQPVPIGVPGELHIGGLALARGYLNRADLTTAKFICDPFSSEPGARMYKTGDLCRWLPDGNLEFLGRIDEQVKIRGFRIELGEIESVLCRCPGVRKAVVVAREEPQRGKRLVAYVVPGPGKPPTGYQLRQFVKDNLPDYMVPSAFVTLDALPLNSSGKVNRKALPAPTTGIVRHGERPFVAPRTVFEQFLAQLWEEVLGVEPVGVHDDFFELGGNSLQVALLVHKLQEKLGEYVYTLTLFDAPNIEALAVYLRKNYGESVTRLFGPEQNAAGSGRSAPLDQERLAGFRKLIRVLPDRPAESRRGGKNPTAAFILSPPRSGSTLFRVMLAGHPGLFAPPELQLLNFNTLMERRKGFPTDRDNFWLNGAVRALMEIKGWDAERSESFMKECERRGMSVQEFYRLTQTWLGERLFIDKTPFYALDPATLNRAEADFEDTRYLYLVRHPGAMIASFEEAKLHLFFPSFLTGDPGCSARELAEMVWTVSHQNILAFLKNIPAERQHRVTFEELVREPRATMEAVSRFLGVEFHPDMLDPYKDKRARMTDPHHPMARMLGDVKFHEHRGVEAHAAERKKGRCPDEVLSTPTRQLAHSLGYVLAPPAPAGACSLSHGHSDAGGPVLSSTVVLPRSGQTSRSEGRRSVVSVQSGGQKPAFFCVHPAGGTVFCYRDLARHLGADQPVYGLEAPHRRGRSSPRRIEEMAAHYLEEMRSVQPAGPYLLGGWSMGGVIAFEMARQLHALGEKVALLAMFDSDIPRLMANAPKVDPLRFLSEFAHQCGLELTRETAERLPPEEQLPHLLEMTKAANVVAPDLGLAPFRRLYLQRFRVFRANVRALRRYVPDVLAERVLLLQAEDRSETAPPGPKWDWRELAPNLEVHVVAGNHFSMIREPHVRGLAGRLREHLAAATAAVTS